MITALLEVAQTDLVEEVVTVSGQFKQNLYGLIGRFGRRQIERNHGNLSVKIHWRGGFHF